MTETRLSEMDLEKVENEIDDKIADVVQQILTRARSERQRILSEFREHAEKNKPEQSICLFKKNADFEEILSQIESISFGQVKVFHQDGKVLNKIEQKSDKFPAGSRSSSRSRSRSSSSSSSSSTSSRRSSSSFSSSFSSSSESSFEDNCRKRRRNRPKTDYDSLELVDIYEGGDAFGGVISSPTAVVSLPKLQRFAVMHSGKISLFSPLAEVKNSFKILPHLSGEEKFTQYLATNPSTGQLFCICRGEIYALNPAEMPAEKGCIVAEKRFAPRCKRNAASGLAICGETEQLFSAVGNSIFSFSLPAFQLTSKTKIDVADERDYAPIVCAIRDNDNQLFYEASASLNAVPISGIDTLELQESRVVVERIGCRSPVAFDSDGNILIGNEGIEVRSPTGEECLSFLRSPGSFSPAGIAILQAQSDGELFELKKGEIKCPHVIAATDDLGSRICFFASPVDFN